MNQKLFIEKSDEMLNSMTIDELKSCLHNVARKTPENKRASFIQLLNDCCCKNEKCSSNVKIEYKRLMSDEKVKNKLTEIFNVFEDIKNGELCFSARGYEDYTEGYWDSDWIWEYDDEEGIGRIIEDAALFAHDCVNDFRYEEAASVYKLIMGTTFLAEDEDGGDCIELDFKEIVGERLAGINLKTVALEVLYSEYQIQPEEQRASSLYAYFSYPYFDEIRIEDIFSIGREELKDTDMFLKSWVDFLLQQKGDTASRLLKEGMLYYKGADGLIEIARKGYKEHPSVYLAALMECEKTHDYERMKEIGKEALDILDKDLKLRGEIALKTSQASRCAGDFEYMRECWYEAFYSDSTIANYLRIFADKEATIKYKETAEKRIEKLTMTDRHYFSKSSETDKDNIYEIDYKLLYFFSGHFSEVKNWCMKQKSPLGWSGKFIGYGVNAMLLYLYADTDLKKACKNIAEYFSAHVSFTGKNLIFMTENSVFETETSAQKSGEVFWHVFNMWKSNYILSEDEANSYIKWLESLINKRADAIVSGQHRKSYGKAALLVAALGEVKESMGIQSAKGIIIDKYLKKYPRHTSFRGVLKEYM